MKHGIFQPEADTPDFSPFAFFFAFWAILLVGDRLATGEFFPDKMNVRPQEVKLIAVGGRHFHFVDLLFDGVHPPGKRDRKSVVRERV